MCGGAIGLGSTTKAGILDNGWAHLHLGGSYIGTKILTLTVEGGGSVISSDFFCKGFFLESKKCLTTKKT